MSPRLPRARRTPGSTPGGGPAIRAVSLLVKVNGSPAGGGERGGSLLRLAGTGVRINDAVILGGNLPLDLPATNVAAYLGREKGA